MTANGEGEGIDRPAAEESSSALFITTPQPVGREVEESSAPAAAVTVEIQGQIPPVEDKEPPTIEKPKDDDAAMVIEETPLGDGESKEKQDDEEVIKDGEGGEQPDVEGKTSIEPIPPASIEAITTSTMEEKEGDAMEVAAEDQEAGEEQVKEREEEEKPLDPPATHEEENPPPSSEPSSSPPSPPPLSGTELIAHIAKEQAGIIKDQTSQLRDLIRVMAKIPWGKCQNPPAADLLYKRRPKAKNDQVSIIDGLEVQLIQILDTRGRVSRVKNVEVIIDLMLQASRDETKALLLELIRTSMEPPCLERLVASGGMKILKHWLIGFDKETHWDLLRLLLETLKNLPATYEGLKASALGKVLTKLKKEKSKSTMKSTQADKERLALGRLADSVKQVYKDRLESQSKSEHAAPSLGASAAVAKTGVSDASGTAMTKKDGEGSQEGGGGAGPPSDLPRLAGLESSIVGEEAKATTKEGEEQGDTMDVSDGGDGEGEPPPPPLGDNNKKRPAEEEASNSNSDVSHHPSSSFKKPKLVAPAPNSCDQLPEISPMKPSTSADESKKRRVQWMDEAIPGKELVEVRMFEAAQEDVEEGGDGEKAGAAASSGQGGAAAVGEGGSAGGGGGAAAKSRVGDRSIREMAIEERKREKQVLSDAKKEEGKKGKEDIKTSTERVKGTGWKTPRTLLQDQESKMKKKKETAEVARLEVIQKACFETSYIRETDIPANPKEDGSVRSPLEDFVVIEQSTLPFYSLQEIEWLEGRLVDPMNPANRQQQPLQQQQQQQQQQLSQAVALNAIPPWLHQRLSPDNNGLLRNCLTPQGMVDSRKLQDLSVLIQAVDAARLDPQIQARVLSEMSKYLPCLRSDGNFDTQRMQQVLLAQGQGQQQQLQHHQYAGGRGGAAAGGRPQAPPNYYPPNDPSTSRVGSSFSSSAAAGGDFSGGRRLSPRR